MHTQVCTPETSAPHRSTAEAMYRNAMFQSATVAVHACLSNKQGEPAPGCQFVGHLMQNLQRGPTCSDEEVRF